VRGKALPAWATELGCASWGQVFLKFILAHPAVTCVIPGTAKPEHMRDNVAAGMGRLPDAAERRRIGAESRAYVERVHDLRRVGERLLALYRRLP
jgi:aryl-alcohol dehydrogenase-like predicted oxidoreductase